MKNKMIIEETKCLIYKEVYKFDWSSGLPTNGVCHSIENIIVESPIR
jgi:hypothetical protein